MLNQNKYLLYHSRYVETSVMNSGIIRDGEVSQNINVHVEINHNGKQDTTLRA